MGELFGDGLWGVLGLATVVCSWWPFARGRGERVVSLHQLDQVFDSACAEYLQQQAVCDDVPAIPRREVISPGLVRLGL